MEALKVWHGGVILISHDERFINNVCKQLWVCADGTLSKWWVFDWLRPGVAVVYANIDSKLCSYRRGDVSSYKVSILL